ncbi:MAG: DNA replication and repair protein RecF [Gemmatimonadetes bacterium]|nr:DNA replication and repair protein RecF [Gemmatimonadota bacterium]
MNAPPSLVCRELRLRQFRNFAELDLLFPRPGAAVIGPNGSGKTNLIEALYYLEIFRSFRGAADDQLVRFEGEAFHIRGRFEDPATGREVEVTAAYEKRRRKKVVTVDGAEPERLGDALGRIGVVVFSPSDVAIVAGAPGERRRFLDIVLSLNARGYLGALQRYRHTLRQRNALLRAGAPAAQIDAWTASLVDSGAVIMAERARWVAEHRAAFASRYERIGGEVAARLDYRPSVSGTESPESDFAGALQAELDRLAGRERERGLTLAGPHRDDLGFLRGGEEEGRDLRDFGSGGQQRTAAVSLRLVEAETIRAARGRAPLILLDDIFAELDPGRSRRLLELLEEEPGQAILTAPKASDLEVRHGALPRWRIASGQIVAAA